MLSFGLVGEISRVENLKDFSVEDSFEMTTIRRVFQWFASFAKGAAEGVARAGAVPGAASDAGDKGRCRVYISPYYRTGQKDKGKLR